VPLYEYEAYTVQGKTSRGVIEAATQAAAFEKLRAQGLFVAALHEEAAPARAGKVPVEVLSFTLLQLATLLRAGIPLPQAMETLTGQVPHPTLARALSRLRARLQEGTSFADALAEVEIFGALLPRLVAAGQSVGTLEVLLEEYAQFLERGQAFRQRISGALIYPVIILLACSGLLVFVLTQVTPTLVRIYGSFHMKMPLATQLLLAVSDLMRGAGPYLGVGLLLGLYVLVKVIPPARRDGLLLRIPLYGAVTTWTQMARWARTVALLHRGGVPLVKTLHSAGEVFENQAMGQAMKTVEVEVERGTSLGAALRRIPEVPSLVAQMAETGEKSGELASLLVAAAEFYEKEADRTLQSFIKLLEPGMIVFMGLVVGFLVMAVLLPIFDIHQMVH
jgi:general secretion pathway protein F